VQRGQFRREMRGHGRADIAEELGSSGALGHENHADLGRRAVVAAVGLAAELDAHAPRTRRRERADVGLAGSRYAGAHLIGEPRAVRANRRRSSATLWATSLAPRRSSARLPEPETVTTFDEVAAVVRSRCVAIDVASPAQLRQLAQIVMERVVAVDGKVSGIDLVPAARPFFDQPTSLLLAPPESLGGSGGHAARSARLVRGMTGRNSGYTPRLPQMASALDQPRRSYDDGTVETRRRWILTVVAFSATSAGCGSVTPTPSPGFTVLPVSTLAGSNGNLNAFILVTFRTTVGGGSGGTMLAALRRPHGSLSAVVMPCRAPFIA